MAERIEVNASVYLSEIEPGDKAAYMVHLVEKEIYDNTLMIPYPYTEEDADGWIATVADDTLRQGRPSCWAIREADGTLIGAVGLHDFELGVSHRAEIGYWLAKTHWGQGIMTQAVRSVCEHAFAELGLVRITAHVFHHNDASARVLEKSGFLLEGKLRRHYKKDGRIFDAKLYALVRD